MYKILSLDGGGSWAILQILTLQEKYKDRGDIAGHEILKEYDMIIANSGGSIVLAALAENWTLARTLELFEKKEVREMIFFKNSFKNTFFPVFLTKKWLGPKYSASKKYEAFRLLFSKFGMKSMMDLPTAVGKPSLKLIVCTFDALHNRAKLFKSYSHQGEIHEHVPLVKAIHASSNAPVQYFDFPARIKADGTNIWYYLWDGALGGFNNPVAAGVIEAFKSSVPLDDIKVISLGTGNTLMSPEQKERFYDVRQITIEERANKWRFWRYRFQMEYFKLTIFNQAKTILFNPPDWANYVAFMFLSKTGSSDTENRLVRLSPLIHCDDDAPDSLKQMIANLCKLDMDLTKDEDIELLKTCFQLWRDGSIKNQPIEYHISRDNTLIIQKGHAHFAEAMSYWE